MSKTSFRVPSGVRVDGLAVGGRYATALGFVRFVAGLDELGTARMLDYAAARLERAAVDYARLERKFDNDPKRYASKAAEAEQVFAGWQALVDALLDELTADVEGVTAELGHEPEAVPRVRPEVSEAIVPEPAADEWEIAFEYGSVGGASSNFDLSLRMARWDNRPMTETDALRALTAFRDTLRETGIPQEPPGYRFRAINWRRPGRGGWRPHGRSGTMNDLAAFAAPLYTNAEEDGDWVLRMGAVEP